MTTIIIIIISSVITSFNMISIISINSMIISNNGITHNMQKNMAGACRLGFRV